MFLHGIVAGLSLIGISETVPVLFRLHWCRQRSCLPQFAHCLNLHCACHAAPNRMQWHQ